MFLSFWDIHNCSYREQLRYVRHKRYLTSIRNLPKRPPIDWLGSRSGPIWTQEGLPAEKTLTLKSAKSSQKVKSRN